MKWEDQLGIKAKPMTMGDPRQAPGCSGSQSAAQLGDSGAGPRGSHASRMSVTHGLAWPIGGEHLRVRGDPRSLKVGALILKKRAVYRQKDS